MIVLQNPKAFELWDFFIQYLYSILRYCRPKKYNLSSDTILKIWLKWYNISKLK